jgi:predicted Zn-dependent peptidase
VSRRNIKLNNKSNVSPRELGETRIAKPQFHKTVLANGLRVVSETHPQSLSAALGVWVLRGSRHESPEISGITHFLEHLVFKGTKKRTALEIARSLEVLGGDLNAYTTREYTVYHALCLKEHWPRGLDVLADLVSGMELTERDFKREKSVILQEINMSDEDLEDHIYDEFYERMLPNNSLGRPILGSEETLKSMKLSQIKNYYRSQYTADRIILAAAGNIDHSELVDLATKTLGAKAGFKAHRFHGRDLQKQKKWFATPKPTVFRDVVEKKSEQLHLCMGLPVNSFRDHRRFEAYIVNAALGGGMTSRIYQSVREKKGLVYSIYSSLNTFEDFGCLNIYAASEAKNMSEVVGTIATQIKKMRRDGLKKAELERFKTQVMGSILLGSEDIENRMSSVAINEMIFRDYKDIYEIRHEIEKITMDSAHEFIEKYIRIENLSALIMGESALELKSLLEDLS